MKLGQTSLNPASQSAKLFSLRHVENQPIRILGQRRNIKGSYSVFTAWRVDNTTLKLSYDDETGQTVTPSVIDVAVNDGNVPDRIVDSFFTEYPGESLECVVYKEMGSNGREYWTIADPDEWEGESLRDGPFSGILAETAPANPAGSSHKTARGRK